MLLCNSGFCCTTPLQRLLEEVVLNKTSEDAAGPANAVRASILSAVGTVSPLGIAPTRPAGYIWNKGEIQLARAASRVEVPFVLSSTVRAPMEEVIRDGRDGSKWFKRYLSGDQPLAMRMIDRAWAAGFKTLVFTSIRSSAPIREFHRGRLPGVRPGCRAEGSLFLCHCQRDFGFNHPRG